MPPAPELLAPAGDHDCVRAAVENGADAVYFGLDAGFNARARAANFQVDEISGLMRELHRRGVKGYATLNTLIFSDELRAFARVVEAVAESGVDAVLVQDVGAARLIRRICPDLPLHASTQMTLTSAESIALAESLGMERVVLARELSIEEIVQIRRATSMPLEVFVHGALCVAYSGQCLTSESLGGRSANRGQCAQACRLPYELVCDGRDVDLGPQKYLLSPQDLAAYALSPQLIAAGVSSFKIEGRLKSAEYVATITRHYRAAIDNAVRSLPVHFTPREVEEMELSFSRGFSPGWLLGCDHKMLVPANSSAKRGVRLGTVVEVVRGRVVVDLVASVKRGDGVAFDCGRSADEARGGRVYEVFERGRSVAGPAGPGRMELTFGREAIDVTVVRPGQAVWKTDDPQLTARLRKSFSGGGRRRQPVDLEVFVRPGDPVRVVATTASGARCEVVSDETARVATKHPLTAEVIRDQLGRLGGTPFELRGLVAGIAGDAMVPFSVLGRLRHALVAGLEAAATAVPTRGIAASGCIPWRVGPPHADATGDRRSHSVAPEIHVLVRSLEQVRTVLELGERRLYADFADLRRYRDAIELCRAAGALLFVATPRIQKPDEMGMFQLLHKQQPDGVLARNFGGLRYFRGRSTPVVADFSFNVTNELTAEFLIGEGVQRMTASYDLNREQLLGLVAATPPEWLEVVVHQHMPMFHMEHCVFCAVLSPGTNKTNCGRPCDEHVVQLRDRIGVSHPLTADVGCRNTLFNAVPQSGAEVVPSLLRRGVGHLRVELLDESATEAARIIDAYRELVAGRATGRDVWTRLNASNRIGVTRGTLEERRNPLAIL